MTRRTWDEVRDLVVQMQTQRGPVVERMREVLRHYEGEWVIPLPDVDSEPKLPMLTPALVGDAVDFLATRASSQMPRNSCPALDPRRDTGRRSREFATIRSKAIAATYGESKWRLGRRKFYRHLAAYSTGAIGVDADFTLKRPQISTRDPLSTYPEPQASVDLRAPMYVASVTRRSGGYLRKHFAHLRQENGGPITADMPSEEWELCQWQDEDQIMYGLIGPVHNDGSHISYQFRNGSSNALPSMQLAEAYDNRLGRPTIVCPEAVSLDRISARIGALLGNIELQAKMMALNITAMDRAIFPDMYALGDANGNPTIVGGKWQDGRTMQVNVLKDIKAVGVVNQAPPQQIQQTIDQLERNFSKSTGLVPQAGGETYGALRTGRGIDALASIALDPKIQEMHEITEEWMSDVNALVLDTYKAHWGSRKFSMYSRWPGDRGLVEFVPKTHFETTLNIVSYEIPGADDTQLTQILGSLRGTGAISLATFRAKHPWIGDAEAEGLIVDEEEFEAALKQMILQQLTQGQMPGEFVGLIRDAMVNDKKDIFAAFAEAERIVRERQATAAPPPPDGMQAAPEAMPGVAAGATAMQQQPAQPPAKIQPFSDVANMRQLMTQLAG